MIRMRLVGWLVQPLIMADDGDSLTELPVQPQRVPAPEWQAFKEGGDDAALKSLRAQVEQGARPPGPPAP